MKTATIDQLWDTHRNIVSYEGSETDRPQTIAELKKCHNVLVGDKIQGKIYEAIIDNCVCLIEQTTVRHPHGGTMYIIEVL